MKQISRIISGTMTWGQWGKALDTRGMIDLIEASMLLKINTFDHADIYGGYTTEREFGTAFSDSGIDRETVVFISKCGIQMPCVERELPVKHYSYSKKHIEMSVENSLRNLKTDYLDVLLLHRPSPLMEAETIAETAYALKKSGKIKSLGFLTLLLHKWILFNRKSPWNGTKLSVL